jgi:opacity protein-like surface antigen
LNRSLTALALGCAGLAGSLWAAPAMAAGADTGWYVGGGIGFDIPSDQNFSSANNGVKNGYGTGFTGGFEGGYALDNGFRPELEFRYQHSRVDSVDVTAPSGAQSHSGVDSGKIGATALFANLWYDYKEDHGFFAIIHPYGGLGLGVARISLDDELYHSYSGAIGSSSGSATTYAYQFGAGLSADIFRWLVASFDFRYMMTGNFKIGDKAQLGDGSETGLDGRYAGTSVMLGLKYRFGKAR